MGQHEGYVHLKEYFEKIIELRFIKVEEAVTVSKSELERRLEGLNELRKDVEKDRSLLLRKETYEVEHRLLANEIRALSDKMITMETRHDRKNMFMWLALGISLFIALVSIIHEFIK